MNNRLHARLWANRRLPNEFSQSREQLVLVSAIIERLGLTDQVESEFVRFLRETTPDERKRFVVQDCMSIGSNNREPPAIGETL